MLLAGYSRQALSPNTAITPLSHRDYLGIKLQLLPSAVPPAHCCGFRALGISGICTGESFTWWLFIFMYFIQMSSIIISFFYYKTKRQGCCQRPVIFGSSFGLVCCIWTVLYEGIQNCSRDLCFAGLEGHTQGGELLLHRAHPQVFSPLCPCSLL